MYSSYTPVTAADSLMTAFDRPVGEGPHWAKDLAYVRRTYDARSETADVLSTYGDSYRRGRRCIVPAENVFEPCYETGKSMRWRARRRAVRSFTRTARKRYAISVH